MSLPRTSNFSDAECITRLRNDDADALGVLVRTYSIPLAEYVYRIVQSRDLAKDIVQDVWIWLWDRRHTIELHGSLKGYLFRAAHNRALNAVRDHRTRDRVTTTIASTDERRHATNTGVQNAETDSFQSAVANLVRDMRSPTREIVWLYFGHGLNATEIADVLRIPANNVHKALSRYADKVANRLRPLVSEPKPR